MGPLRKSGADRKGARKIFLGGRAAERRQDDSAYDMAFSDPIYERAPT